MTETTPYFSDLAERTILDVDAKIASLLHTASVLKGSEKGFFVVPPNTCTALSRAECEINQLAAYGGLAKYGLQVAVVDKKRGMGIAHYSALEQADVLHYVAQKLQNPVPDYDLIKATENPDSLYRDIVSHGSAVRTFTRALNDALEAFGTIARSTHQDMKILACGGVYLTEDQVDELADIVEKHVAMDFEHRLSKPGGIVFGIPGMPFHRVGFYDLQTYTSLS